MQRKPSKKSRAKNADERKWQAWLKEQPCSFCGNTSGSIVDHCKGGTYKHNKVLIGEVFCNSKCVNCDNIVTYGVRKNLFKLYGKTDSDATLTQLAKYSEETGFVFPSDVVKAIADL